MKTFHNNRRNSRGTSALEFLFAIAVYGGTLIMTSGAIKFFWNENDSMVLHSQVSSFNRAIYLFRASGGDLSDALTPEQVIAKLRAVEEDPFVLTVQSIVDVGLSPVYQSPEEARSKADRAFWDAERQCFQLTDTGPQGIKAFSDTAGNSFQVPPASPIATNSRNSDSSEQRRAREIESIYRRSHQP